jgi:hypoxanthine phosphoribosyltransferase
VLTYQAFGTTARKLAGQVAADGFEPDLVLAIAGGVLPRSVARCDYGWRRTDPWIDVPRSSQPPVRRRDISSGSAAPTR